MARAASVIDRLDQGASIALEIGALAAALALWRDYGWRVSVPLASAGYVLAQSHFPPYGAFAGPALGIAVWQYLVLKRRIGGQPPPLGTSTFVLNSVPAAGRGGTIEYVLPFFRTRND
jgi:hypothetical protein